jgi:hypothetical protein
MYTCNINMLQELCVKGDFLFLNILNHLGDVIIYQKSLNSDLVIYQKSYNLIDYLHISDLILKLSII